MRIILAAVLALFLTACDTSPDGDFDHTGDIDVNVSLDFQRAWLTCRLINDYVHPEQEQTILTAGDYVKFDMMKATPVIRELVSSQTGWTGQHYARDENSLFYLIFDAGMLEQCSFRREIV